MRKLLFILLLIPSVSNAQAVARLLRSLSPAVTTTPYNFIWLDTSSSNRMKVMNIDTAKRILGITTGTVTSVGLTSSNLTVTGSPITSSGSMTVNLPSVGTAGTYNRVTTDAQGRVTAGKADSTYSVTRSFNSNFTPSTTRMAFVRYSVSISCALTLAGGQTGTVFLEYSPDASTWTEAGRVVNGNTGTLIVGIAITNAQTIQVSGVIPANYFVRLRSTGTATITYVSGQETLL